MILVFENGKWLIDRLTDRDYDGVQPREPRYKVGDFAVFRRQKVKIEWCCCTLQDNGEQVFWYDVRKGNKHSEICLEDELKNFTNKSTNH